MTKKLSLDPRAWSFQDYADFLNAKATMDWAVAFPLVMKLVVSWDYDLPLDPDAWQELPFSDLPAITDTIEATLAAYQENLDISKVRVDMSKWKMRDFIAFRDAARKGDVEGLETLLKKVADIRGLQKDARLSFEQGALLTRAVGKQTDEMFAQGN